MRRRVTYTTTASDRNPNRGIGIRLPFNDFNVFTTNYTTKDQIKSNLTNYLLTNKGERVFNPEFGADLRKLLFDQLSDFTDARDILLSNLGIYFPMITVNALDFSPDYDRNLLNIKLNYSINNNADSILIQIT
jgi:phage baseplate assembly protein W